MDTESPEEVRGPIFTSVVKSPFPISYVFPSTESVDFYVVTLIDVCVCDPCIVPFHWRGLAPMMRQIPIAPI